MAFNLGVEAGQLAIVMAFLPLAYGARHTVLYARMVFQGGSLAILVLAALWLVERGLDLESCSADPRPGTIEIPGLEAVPCAARHGLQPTGLPVNQLRELP